MRIAWLANLRASIGQAMKAGAEVSLGSIVKIHWISPEDAVEAEIEGLGTARVTFS